MTGDGIQVIQFLFTEIWQFFTAWKVPGTDTTPGAFLVFLLLGGIALRFIVRLFSTNLGGGSSDK